MRHSRITLLAVAVLLGVANQATAALFPYSFQKIAEAPGDFSAVTGAGLNNDGSVYLGATPTGGSPGAYEGRPGDLRRVDFPDFVSLPRFSRNNAGEYAVYGRRTGQTGPGVYRVAPGGAITTIAEPSFLSAPLLAGPVIADSGHVTFATGDLQFQRVYVGNGTATPDQKVFSSGNLELLKISPDGRPLAHVTQPLFANALSLDGQTIVNQSSGYFIKGSADVAGNATDTRVVFPANALGGQPTTSELFVWRDGVVTPVPDSALLGDFITTAINDAGVIAARATPPGGAERVLLFKDGVRQTLVTVGDSLFDSTITDLGLGDINNGEQLTFSATLADGRTVTVLATPVPEPAAAGLLALAAAIGLRRRR